MKQFIIVDMTFDHAKNVADSLLLRSSEWTYVNDWHKMLGLRDARVSVVFGLRAHQLRGYEEIVRAVSDQEMKAVWVYNYV